MAPPSAGWDALDLGNQALSAISGPNPLTCCRKLAAWLSADYYITMPVGMHYLLLITFSVYLNYCHKAALLFMYLQTEL